MTQRLLLAAATLALLSAPGVAYAECADFQASSADLRLTYDPYDNGLLDRVFTLRVRRLDPAATAVRILLVDTDPTGGYPTLGVGGPAQYDIRWLQDSGRPVFAAGAEQPNATNGALIAFGSGPSGDAVNETFRIRIPAGQDVAAGGYFQPLEVRYLCYRGGDAAGTPEFQTGGQVAIDLVTPDRISTFIGSAGIRRGQIDFGALDGTTGSGVKSLIVTTQATLPYDIDVRSDRGALKRSDADAYAVGYRMRLSGLAIRNGARVSCARSPAPTGRSHPLQVELSANDLARAPAGNYADTVTLTFSPRLNLSGSSGCALSMP